MSLHNCTRWIIAAIWFFCSENTTGILPARPLFNREPFQIQSELTLEAGARISDSELIPELKTALPEGYRDMTGLEGSRTRSESAGSDGSWHLKLSFLQDGPDRFQKDFIPSELKSDDPYLMMRSLKSLLQSPPDWYTLKSLGGVFMPVIYFGVEF